MDDIYSAYNNKLRRKSGMWKTMNGGYPGKYCPVVARARPYSELSDIVDFIESQHIRHLNDHKSSLSE